MVTWFWGDHAEYYVNPSYDPATYSILQIQFITTESATTYETSARLHHKQVMLTRVTSKGYKVSKIKYFPFVCQPLTKQNNKSSQHL
jgi:hypothetical protein